MGLGEQIRDQQRQFYASSDYFEAGGSSAESEVWADLRDLTSAQRFEGTSRLSTCGPSDEASRLEIMDRVRDDDQFKLKVITETDYFENQKSSSLAIKVVAYIIAGFLTVVQCLLLPTRCIPRLPAAVVRSARSCALGFPRRAILTSFMLESLLLCSLGGLLGCLATIPLNGISGGTRSPSAKSHSRFALDPRFCCRVWPGHGDGMIGGLFPAIRAVRLQITDALRQR